MNITKRKRGSWKVQGTGANYATVDLTAGYSAAGDWVHGWRVLVRRADGSTLRAGEIHKTRKAATAEAVALINE